MKATRSKPRLVLHMKNDADTQKKTTQHPSKKKEKTHIPAKVESVTVANPAMQEVTPVLSREPKLSDIDEIFVQAREKQTKRKAEELSHVQPSKRIKPRVASKVLSEVDSHKK